jgi:hypothetical protein
MALGLGQLAGGLLLGSMFGENMMSNKGLLQQDEDQEAQLTDPNVSNQVAQAPQQQFGGIGGVFSGISNQLFQGMSPEQVARLGQGFNTMRLEPDPTMATVFQSTIDASAKNAGIKNAVTTLKKMGKPHLADLVATQQLTVAEALRYAQEDKSLGDTSSMLRILRKNSDSFTPEQNAKFMDLADILEADPSMNTEVWKAYLDIAEITGDDGKEYALGLSEIMTHQGKDEIDPETGKSREGQHYQLQTNKKDGTVTKVWLDSYGETLAQKDERERVALEIKNDKEKAMKMGIEAQNQAQDLFSQIQMFEQALQYVEDGALSSYLTSKLPAIDDRTALLRGISNKLGISVINSATFGALSEREMQMAMATNLDLNLPPDELREMILEQIRVRRKLALEFTDQAIELLTGGDKRYSTFVVKMAERQKKHNAVVWEKLKPHEIEALMNIGIDREAYKDTDYEWRRAFFDARGK